MHFQIVGTNGIRKEAHKGKRKDIITKDKIQRRITNKHIYKVLQHASTKHGMKM